VTPAEGEWVAVALLGRTRGNRGELSAVALTGKPERLENLREVYLFGDGARYEVEKVWFHNGAPVFKFRGIDSIGDAERLVRAEVRIPFSQRAELEPGEFYESDLLGCEVVERATGESLGRVSAWNDAGGPGLLVLDSELLIPFVRTFCLEIDIAAKRIVVDLPEGLKELNRT
jgi:16S rRNA processing protein RimM